MSPYGAIEPSLNRTSPVRMMMPIVLALCMIALLLIAAGDNRTQEAFELLVRGTAEQMQEARALQQEDIQQAGADQTRANEVAALIATATGDLSNDEKVANALALQAQQQARVTATLQQKLSMSSTSALSQAEAQLSGDEEQDTAQQNQLLEEEAVEKRQEQQLLLGESEQSNLAATDEEQAHMAHAAALKDEGLIAGEKNALTADQKQVTALFAREKPLIAKVQALEMAVGTARVGMQQAMSRVDQMREDVQAAQIQAQMDAREARRNSRDNAERALNRAVAKEQQLQSGPNHERLKLTGAMAKQLAAAEAAVKKAQAQLASAYSPTGAVTAVPAATLKRNNARLAKAQTLEDAATARVENIMTKLNKAKGSLGRIQAKIEADQSDEVNTQHLLGMIASRAQGEEADIAMVTGRAAAARQQAAQDQKRVNSLAVMAKGVAQRIALLSKKRNNDMAHLTTQEMSKKKVAAKQQAMQAQVAAANTLLSLDHSNAAKAYAKVTQQAQQIAALKAEESADRLQASSLLTQAQREGQIAVSPIGAAVQKH